MSATITEDVIVTDAKYRGHVQINGPCNRMAVEKAHILLNRPRDTKTKLHPLLTKGLDTVLRLQVGRQWRARTEGHAQTPWWSARGRGLAVEAVAGLVVM